MRRRHVRLGGLVLAATLCATGRVMAFEDPVWPWGTNPITGVPVNSFCDAQQAILDRGAIPQIPSWLLTSLAPGTGDIGGDSWAMKQPPAFSMTGNGWIDCPLELKLVEEALRNTGLDIPAHGAYTGLSHAKVLAALNADAARMAIDMGSVFDSLPNGWLQVLLGHMLVGTGYADFSEVQGDPPEPNMVIATGSAGFVKMLLFLMGDNVTNSQIDLANYTRMPEFFGKEGDADGDGFSNEDEYQYVGEAFPPEQQMDRYVEYALDPAKNPHCVLAFTFQPCPTSYQVGQTMTLGVDVACATGVIAYEWAKDGTRIQDATGRVFTKSNLAVGDSGAYTCTAMDESSAAYSATIQIEVSPLPPLPVAAPFTLGSAAVILLAYGGLISLRKRG